ncbi:Ca(2+)/H(+) antiporter [Porphyridium purpureum]|uniref:Ca(2+)/H(+) antiporter n=1 Tax=Porphyridium purpureum TaxID=35688 RepID=A0A5J4YT01_PORPP|nr:Ca(2+)/H(+) antiporter [Porphyridium purpureum]|eukprot:POR6802..scf227_4
METSSLLGLKPSRRRPAGNVGFEEDVGSMIKRNGSMILNGKGFALHTGLEGYWSPPLSYLLFFTPFALAWGWMEWNPTVTFALCFLSLIPLALVLGTATEDIALYSNDTIGGLLNATFGNAVEMIIAVQALRQGFTDLVQATLLGSILSNLLLVLGCSFLFGGLIYKTQRISRVVVSSVSTVLAVVVFGFACPAVLSETTKGSQAPVDAMSLITSIALLVIYALYLFFQLVTHVAYFNAGVEGDSPQVLNGVVADMPADDADGGSEQPKVALPIACGILLGSCLVVAWVSEYLVDSVDAFASNVGLPPRFVTLILLPIVGNAAEHFSAVTVAMKNKLDLSVGIALGSSIQIAIFVGPSLVILSWICGWKHLTLDFDMFPTVLVVASVWLVNIMIRDFEANWFEGAILCVTYFVIAAFTFVV